VGTATFLEAKYSRRNNSKVAKRHDREARDGLDSSQSVTEPGSLQTGGKRLADYSGSRQVGENQGHLSKETLEAPARYESEAREGLGSSQSVTEPGSRQTGRKCLADYFGSRQVGENQGRLKTLMVPTRYDSEAREDLGSSQSVTEPGSQQTGIKCLADYSGSRQVGEDQGHLNEDETTHHLSTDNPECGVEPGVRQTGIKCLAERRGDLQTTVKVAKYKGHQDNLSSEGANLTVMVGASPPGFDLERILHPSQRFHSNPMATDVEDSQVSTISRRI